MRKEQVISTTNNNQMEEKGMKSRFIHLKKRFVPAVSGALMGVMLMSTTCFAAGTGTSAVTQPLENLASKYGMVLKPCAEGEDLAKYGADCSGCMTVHTFETALNSRLEVPKRKKNQRNGECACLLGTDIGAYDTCGHLCKYCYANVNPVLVKENMRKHNPDSPFLIGGYRL